ncbi:hypothetical protein N2152v2_002618 [Parachlorella kessleri]
MLLHLRRHAPQRSCHRGNNAIPAAQARTITPYPDPFPDLAPGGELPEDYGNPGPNPPKHRRAGVILHPTSLPGKYGIGEIGQEAVKFVDWLAATGMQLWQMLPLVPPDSFWSPYSGLDALCGNPLLIPLDELAELGLLEKGELPAPQPVESQADFKAVHKEKTPLLEKAAGRLLSDPQHKELKEKMVAFRRDNPWVEPSALFSVLTEQPAMQEKAWWDWEAQYRDADPATMEAFKEEHAGRIDTFIAIQFFFDHFWQQVKGYANSLGVKVVGDMPIYVGGHSADVWANRHLFELAADGKPELVSGVPPDAFSATGQLWGSPLYDWKGQLDVGVVLRSELDCGRLAYKEPPYCNQMDDYRRQAHQEDGYQWWVQRFKRTLTMYDETRVDHFRGFAGYWAIDAEAETAMDGKWLKGPGLELFEALEAALGDVPILAEDLGVITKDVHQLRIGIGAPGMVVLQFAWGGGPTNTHLTHNHYENCFCYPGTHDNQTAVGWWKRGATPYERNLIRRYMGLTSDDIAWGFIQESMKSVARTAVVAMQDIMRLDDSARMNTPGKAEGNWSWRVGDSSVWEGLQKESEQLRKLIEIYDRLAPARETPQPEAPAAAGAAAGGETAGADGEIPAAQPVSAGWYKEETEAAGIAGEGREQEEVAEAAGFGAAAADKGA